VSVLFISFHLGVSVLFISSSLEEVILIIWIFFSGMVILLSTPVFLHVSPYLFPHAIIRDLKNILSQSINRDERQNEVRSLRQKIIQKILKSSLAYRYKDRLKLDQINNIFALYVNRIGRQYKNKNHAEMLETLKGELEFLFSVYKEIYSVIKLKSLPPVREIFPQQLVSDLGTVREFRLKGGGGSYATSLFRKRIQNICSELKDIFNLHILFGNQNEREKEITRQILEIIAAVAFLFILYISDNFINQRKWYRRLIYLTSVNITEDNVRFIIEQIDKKIFDEIFSLSKYRTLGLHS
jgi:hypothetical protein